MTDIWDVSTVSAPLTLTADAFNQIVQSLRSDDGRRFNEKRMKPRVGVRGRVSIVLLSPDGTGEKTLTVWVRDLSANGIGILLNQPLPQASRFAACFHRSNEQPLTLTYVVAHSKAAVKGLYTIGAHLVGADDQSATDTGA
jgi:hypothetical protein